MLGLGRRKRIEGWAVDIEEAGAEERSRSLRERLADNNKLWFAAIVVVLVVSLLLAQNARNAVQEKDPYETLPRAADEDSAVDEAHRQFESTFLADKSLGLTVFDAHFINPNRFRIVVPASAGTDEIDYLSKTAAMRIRHSLHHRVVVEVYARRAATGAEELAATTRWDPKKYGFVVTNRKIEQ